MATAYQEVVQRYGRGRNLPKGEVEALQETPHRARLGLRRMGLTEERRPGTLIKPRKPQSKAKAAEAPAAPAVAAGSDERAAT
jgi:hypothetical protein